MEQLHDQMELLNAFPLLIFLSWWWMSPEKTASVRLIEAMTVKQIFKQTEKFEETAIGFYLKISGQ